MITVDIGGVDVTVKIDSKPINENQTAGWTYYKRTGVVFVNGEEKFRTDEQESGGCGYVSSFQNRALIKECLDWVVDNTVY